MRRSQQRITKSEATSDTAMVTAMHPLAAEAGVEILEQGGNAADAAIAMALAIGVVEPYMSGLGGAAYALAYDARSRTTLAFDGSAAAPAAASPDLFELAGEDSPRLGVYGWRSTREDASETGYRSIAVPGALAALEKLHQAFSTRSWEELSAPAIRLAEDGFAVDEQLFVQCAASASRLRPFPETLAVFYRSDGTARVPSLDPAVPELLVQPALARTLRRIAAEGPVSFYRGALAEEIAGLVRARGGLLSVEDLAGYEALVSAPRRVAYRGRRVELLPGASGGPTVALALNVLGRFDLSSLPYDSADRLHLLAEAMRIAFDDRFRLLADPTCESVPMDAFYDPAYAAERSRFLSPSGSRGDEAHPPGRGDSPRQHTTHLNAADRWGNLVSLTATLGARFGSGAIVPECGVVLNNGMMWFDPEPGRLSSIRPRKRALHAAAPTLVFDGEHPFVALGSPGARRIMSAILQVLVNLLDHRMGIQEAIESPRIHREGAGPLLVESRFPPAVLEALAARGYEVRSQQESFLSSSFGRPSGIRIDRAAGRFQGGVEPYRAGTALGL